MIHPTHQRLHDLIVRYGAPAEIEESQRVLDLMAEMDDGSGEWARLTELTLPGALILSAKKVAMARRNRFRTFAQECRAVEGQYAAAIMLGLELPHRLTAAEAFRSGNLGGGISAFVAKTGSDSLYIALSEKDSRRLVLITGNDKHRYEFSGWLRAGEGKQPEYMRQFVRDGVLHEGYVVPHVMLHPVETWRD